MNFKEQYNIYLSEIETEINTYFSISNIPQKSVIEAMQYAITAGGKRIRPVLVMATAQMFGGNLKDAVRIALAVECIHTYSLIHDDLPCMDNDDMRRGRPSCHKQFGESTALLAGDGLLNSAFEILSDIDCFNAIDAKNLIYIIRELSSASGVFGMIGGQVVDLEHETKSDITLDEIIYKHNGKTGALIKVSAICGALCANLNSKSTEIKAIKEFSSNLGLAFQVKDDILDVTGNEELLGKPIGSDDKSGKTTFVSLLGLTEANEYLNKITIEAKSALKVFGEKAWFLNELADFLLDRTY